MYPVGGMGSTLGFWVVVVWLLVLSFLVWQNNCFVKKLFPKNRGGLKEKLEEVLKEIEGLDQFKKQSLGSIQKIALKRYNPYRDTGGDQSFSLALLNGKSDGLRQASDKLRERARPKPQAPATKITSREIGFLATCRLPHLRLENLPRRRRG